MLTGDTITDVQIRLLRDANRALLRLPRGVDIDTRIRLADEIAVCETVLVNAPIPAEMRAEARARCAEILAARKEQS